MYSRTKAVEDIIVRLKQYADHPVQNLDIDLDDLTLDIDPSTMSIDFDDQPPGRMPPAPAARPETTHSTRTSIRIPCDVLDAFKAQAKLKGTRYQSLIIRELRDAAKGWSKTPPVPKTAPGRAIP